MGATYIEPVLLTAHEELSGSPTEQWDGRKFGRAVRKLKCAWADRHALRSELVGGVLVTGSNYTITRSHSYPGFTPARVVDVQIAPWAPVGAMDGGMASYETAELTVTYAIPEHGVNENPLASESLEPVAEFLTLSNRQLYWDAGQTQPLDTEEAPGKLIRMMDWVYTRKEVITVPSATFTLIGNVNDASVASPILGNTFEAETLLYNPPMLRRDITDDGSRAWEITYRFTYRPDGWNKFYKAGSATPQIIYNSGGTQEIIYATADFSTLILS